MQTQNVPLFIQTPIVVDDSLITPMEGRDYTYDAATQTAVWLGPTNNYTRTMFSDQKVDSVSHITPDLPVITPEGPSLDMRTSVQ